MYLLFSPNPALFRANLFFSFSKRGTNYNKAFELKFKHALKTKTKTTQYKKSFG